jgi:methyl-accepting chemotaxis protein
MVDTVRQHGQGFVAYQWPKPGSDAPVDKVSYVQGFEPWGWVVGSGIYLDVMYGDLWRDLSGPLAGVLAGIAVGMLAGFYLLVCFHHALTQGLGESRHHLRAMAGGDLTRTPTPRGTDEAAELMRDLRDMQDSLRGMVARVSQASGRHGARQHRNRSRGRGPVVANRARGGEPGTVGVGDGRTGRHGHTHRQQH